MIWSRFKHNKFNFFILILIIILICIGFLSYGVLANAILYKEQNSIPSWNIGIVDVQSKKYGGAIENKLIVTNTSIDFDVTFTAPNQYIVYTIYVENSGLIDAKLSSITGIKSANAAKPYSIKYFADYSSEKLDSKSRTSFNVTVKWEENGYNYEITNDFGYSKKASISFNYVQR